MAIINSHTAVLMPALKVMGFSGLCEASADSMLGLLHTSAGC